MLPEFATRMKAFEPGIFQVLNEEKEKLIKQGRKVYNLSVGTPDFVTPQRIMDAVTKAAGDAGNYKYSLIDIAPLRDALKKRYKDRYQVEINDENLMSVYGSQEGMAHVAFAICNPGDVVLVPDPGYPIFSIGPSLCGAEIETYPLLPENDYLPKLSEIPEDIVSRCKMIIVSYPLNPICKCAPDSFYDELIEWATQNDILILHDNAYSDIIYDGRVGKSIFSHKGAMEQAVEFYSLSKSYNYTGARMSFLVGNPRVIDVFRRFRSQIDYGTFLPVQYGAVAALSDGDREVKEQCMEYQKRRDALCGGLRSIGWPCEDSEGTMFVWTRIPSKFGDDDTGFVMQLMNKTGLICTPGSSFGKLGKGYVRFALVLPPKELSEAVESVKASGILD